MRGAIRAIISSSQKLKISAQISFQEDHLLVEKSLPGESLDFFFRQLPKVSGLLIIPLFRKKYLEKAQTIVRPVSVG